MITFWTEKCPERFFEFLKPITDTKNLIKNLEFAYGEYKNYQVAITKIETLTGLDFVNLRNHDPINQLEFTFKNKTVTL